DISTTSDGALLIRAEYSSKPVRLNNKLRSARSSNFFFSSRRRHTRLSRDWSSDVCSSDLRKQKRMTLTWKVPAREDRFFRMHREREEHEDQSGLRHLQLRRRVHLQRA